MSLRHAHVPTERLAVLALAGTDDEQGADGEALAHVSTCHACATTLSRLMADLEDLRHEAHHEADAHFPEAVLEAQRTRVLDRLAHLGHAARVLPFPMRAVSATVARPVVNRRLVSAAAAAGLFIGLVTGQVMHLGPWERTRGIETRTGPVQSALLPAHAGIVPISATASLTDYVTLTEVDSAVQLRRAADVMALDALTPANDATWVP
jgi:hypothetical protein